jgi:hypothetical protein
MPTHFDRPVVGPKTLRIFLGIVLAGTEFVEIVITGGVFLCRDFFIQRHRILLIAIHRIGRLRTRERIQQQGSTDSTGGFDEVTSLPIK